MARRSPWAAQSKKERTRVRAEMRHLPLGKKRVFFETAFLGAAGSKREAKLQLVRQNRPATIRGAVKQSGGNRKILEETLRSPERLRPAALDAAVGALLRETLGSELKQAGEETKRHLAKYLSKRGMQVSKRDDRQALDAAMTQFMNEHVTQNGKRLFNPTEPLDLRWFEREYLRQRKNKRTIEQAFARDVNHMVRMVSEEHRLNARQQRALRQWF
ncbi:MAG: hypothetical protein Q7R47_03135, partial [Candidatus Diapherotrites archaeon]|nr:hypothetical protein [Candidatus Diapherotrites archaeon]